MKKLTLPQTIMLIAIAMFALQLINGIINMTRINSMGHHIEMIETQYMPITEHITVIAEYQLKQEVEFERAFRYAHEKTNNSAATDHFKHAIENFNALSSKFNEEIKSTEKRILHAIEIIEDNKESKMLAKLEYDLETIDEQHQKWIQHVQAVFTLLDENQFNDAIEKSAVVEDESLVLTKNVTKILSSIAHLTEQIIHKLKLEEESILNIGMVLLAISLVVAVVLTKGVIRNLNKDLSELSTAISRISNGDLVTKVSSKLGKEFGLDIMRQHLNETLLIVENTANEVLGASNELAQISAAVNQTAELQVQEIEQISTAMSQMEATSLEVARHAESTQSSTKKVTSTTNETKKFTNDAMTSISQLTASLELSSKNIYDLEKHSANIASVLNVI
ncbi:MULTISPECIES: methyl-accepting chemotaxis protein [Colwellia]|uniref:Methyl-accepting chemotaxis protein n=1 Tax=Colwellia marinimaniae TaxID=1513592 RepID=A0ABQ0MUN8_9GAMM|nr:MULTISPECIES: methyl-accepting chemotaxis protein [Colwellia]GAW96080.1 methyl-accepting chemotaxis protein [Colwellia marinimaniae]